MFNIKRWSSNAQFPSLYLFSEVYNATIRPYVQSHELKVTFLVPSSDGNFQILSCSKLLPLEMDMSQLR